MEINNNINVCPHCDKPIYFTNKANEGLYKCYNCKIWVIPNNRPYKEIKKGKSWGDVKRRRKTFISDEDLMGRQEFIDRLKAYKITNRLTEMRNKALIAFLYLTAARIEEVVGMIDQNTRERITEPITLAQLEYNLMNNEKYLVINRMRVLKRRPKIDDEGREKVVLRKVPVLIKDEEYPVECIEKYIKSLVYRTLDTPLFNMTYQRAWQISCEFGGKFNHYWRHLRLSHLVDMYGFSDLELQQYVSWSSTTMASKYTHLNWSSIAKKMSINSNAITQLLDDPFVVQKSESLPAMQRLSEDEKAQTTGDMVLDTEELGEVKPDPIKKYQNSIKKAILKMPDTKGWKAENINILSPKALLNSVEKDEIIIKQKTKKNEKPIKESDSYLKKFNFLIKN